MGLNTDVPYYQSYKKYSLETFYDMLQRSSI